MIRVVLPAHLRTLAGTGKEVALTITGAVTISSIIDALESNYPPLRGTLRDPVTQRRRNLVRFFACTQDWSNELPHRSHPAGVATGSEPFLIVGAIAGG